MRNAFAGVLVSVVVGFACAGWAATYYVDQKRGNDAQTGSEDAPWQTLARGAKDLKPGDTLIVREGIYREQVRPPKGDQGTPVTLKAARGERVVISGADIVSGWRKATAEDVGGPHPHLDKLFVADVNWIPPRYIASGELRLYEKGALLRCARTPDEGWWSITKGLSLTEFTDEVHLTQTEPSAWDGWTVAILEQAGGSVQHIEVKSFDPQTHKIELARPYSAYRQKIDETRDRYYVENHPSTLDGPGQFVFKKLDEKTVRLIVWPSRPGADGKPEIEIPRRTNLIYLPHAAHLVIDGFEVRHSDGHGIGMSTGGSPVNVVITNCYIHDNRDYGIEMRQPVSCAIMRNVIRNNSHGIALSGSRDCLIEENDIGWNYVDGIVGPGGTRNLTIRRNWIHDHFLWGHPDNIQFWSDVEGVTLQDNVMVNAGQTMMSAEMRNTRLIHNIWLGSRAISMICGGDGWEIVGNTVCATGPAPTNLNGKRFVLTHNIFCPLHGIVLYGIPDPDTFSADYNLLWPGDSYRGALVFKGAWKDAATSLDAIRSKFNLEAHGIVADPEFRNAARFFAVTDYRRVVECTQSKLILEKGSASMFSVGDNVEVDFDGKVRKVTEVGPDYICIQPPLSAPPDTIQTVANWKEKTDFKWDLRLTDTSPAKGKGEGGKDIGCGLNIQAYVAGDFDGDGKRDLPEIPSEDR